MQHHILEFVVAKHFPRVALEYSVLSVSRVVVKLASILLMLLPLPTFIADPQEHELLPVKIEITVPSVFEKLAHLLHVRDVELLSARCCGVLHYFLPKH